MFQTKAAGEPRAREHELLSGAVMRAMSIGAAASMLLSGCSRFSDTSGPNEDNFGRTVNGLSTMLAGIVAQQVETNGSVNVTINKPGWSDAAVNGSVSSNSIHTEADLSLASCSFNASGTMGAMRGHIEKSEFDWDAVQTGPGSWRIERFGLKFNYTLTVSVDHGKIDGVLQKPGDWDWTISGTYGGGKMDMKVSTGWTEPSFSISGNYVPSQAPAVR